MTVRKIFSVLRQPYPVNAILLKLIVLGWRQTFQKDQSSCWNPEPKRSPLSPTVWWEVTSGPVIGAIFISLSKQLLCPCGIDPEWHCRVGSPLPLSAGNPGVPNRSPSHGPGSPSGSRSTQLHNTCGLARCHLYSSGTHMTTVACVVAWSLTVCDSVCVFMQIHLWPCLYLGDDRRPSHWGAFLSLLATKSLPFLFFKGNIWIWTRFSFCLCTWGCCFYNTEVFYTKNVQDVEQRVSWWTDFCAASLSREGG